MPKVVWINGEIFPLETATVSVADHAHLYGDGLFEGIRFYNQKVFKLDEHLDRLYHGIKAMGFKMHLEQEELRQIVLRTCQHSELDSGYIRINVTRGTGLGLDPKNIDLTPNVVVLISNIKLYPEEAYQNGLTVVTSPYRVLPPDCLDPRLKCIGRYAANILAKELANKAGAGEALMLNTQGHVAECTGDNIFIIHNSEIYTPHPSSGILEGITRNTVMKLARKAGYKIHETFMTLYDVLTADEAFLTGTAAEVIPMTMLDNHSIGSGEPGSITKELIKLFREHTQTGTPFSAVEPFVKI
jgi:branched-chain amino acid aminotransferase